MATECNPFRFDFHPLDRREVVARFDGGHITSDGGGLLLRETGRLTGIIRQFADRTRTATLRADQIRLWFSTVAYALLQALRRLGLAGTSMAKAQCQTIRLRLLKIGALIRVTVRKLWISLAESYPYKPLFAQVYEKLRRGVPVPIPVPIPLRC